MHRQMLERVTFALVPSILVLILVNGCTNPATVQPTEVWFVPTASPTPPSLTVTPTPSPSKTPSPTLTSRPTLTSTITETTIPEGILFRNRINTVDYVSGFIPIDPVFLSSLNSQIEVRCGNDCFCDCFSAGEHGLSFGLIVQATAYFLKFDLVSTEGDNIPTVTGVLVISQDDKDNVFYGVLPIEIVTPGSDENTFPYYKGQLAWSGAFQDQLDTNEKWMAFGRKLSDFDNLRQIVPEGSQIDTTFYKDLSYYLQPDSLIYPYLEHLRANKSYSEVLGSLYSVIDPSSQQNDKGAAADLINRVIILWPKGLGGIR